MEEYFDVFRINIRVSYRGAIPKQLSRWFSEATEATGLVKIYFTLYDAAWSFNNLIYDVRRLLSEQIS